VGSERLLGYGVAALAAAVALVQTLRLWWRGRRARRRMARAAAGEARAEALLERRGYTVVGRQVQHRSRLFVDGEAVPFELRADLVVARGGRRYVAEVKTGREAPRPTHPATRRQLLEYRAVLDVDGALLVDAEAERVYEVAFPAGASPRRGWAPFVWVAVGGAIGALLARLAG
jgi:Holliday junction resolvase-like predicted endonuclease